MAASVYIPPVGAGIRTMASLLGDRKSEGNYAFLLFAPFSLLLLFILVSRSVRVDPKMPVTFLVMLLALPLALKLMKKGKRRHSPNSL